MRRPGEHLQPATDCFDGASGRKTGGDRDITPKQRKFVQLYLSNGMRATKAARDAGYSQKNVGQRGYLNLQIPRIKREIEKVLAKERKKYGVTRESLAMEYDDAIIVAKEQSDTHGMVKAIAGKAKLYGLDVQKIEDVFSLVDLLDDE